MGLVPMGTVETDLRRIRQRLEAEGWLILRNTGDHTVYGHGERFGRIPVTKGRGDLPQGTAKSIGKAAGWI
jgi:predicted RNA binding protein YcfA (HicA-like mRNA interferase family)